MTEPTVQDQLRSSKRNLDRKRNEIKELVDIVGELVSPKDIEAHLAAGRKTLRFRSEDFSWLIRLGVEGGISVCCCSETEDSTNWRVGFPILSCLSFLSASDLNRIHRGQSEFLSGMMSDFPDLTTAMANYIKEGKA